MNFTFSLPVLQGTTEAVAYAGALEDGYRWGHGNVAEFAIEVPELPATRLTLEVETSARDEYWSDGTANVDVAFSLRNEGYAEFENPQPISFVCHIEEQIVEGCGGEVTISLADGFGPETTESLMLRMPMGITLLEAEYGAEAAAQFEVEVPERILGVEREVWECFSDRPEEGAENEGCGGWFSETIVKWDQSKPIRVWATGDEEYVEVLDETLEELSPLLNLEFQRVETEDEADVKAYVGVSVEEAKAADFYCEHSWGCAGWQQGPPNVIETATIGVWPDKEYFRDMELQALLIKRVTQHEVLHALVPIHHRVDPLSAMSVTGLMMAEKNPMDEALIRLHSNPLVKPGMIVEEVAELIVFEDELLDASPPDVMDATPLDLVRQAYVALHAAEAVEFKIRGSWVGCGSEFGVANLQTATLSSSRGSATILRFKDRGSNFLVIRDPTDRAATEYWSTVDGIWETVYASDVWRSTIWSPGLSNAFSVLNNILILADPEKMKATEIEPGKMRLDVYLEKSLINVGWSDGETLTANLTIDVESHEILSYFMSWRFNPQRENVCTTYATKATAGVYEVEIEIPEIILRDSKILRRLKLQDS